MDTQQSKSGLAQPAEESLKKHGDQLQKPVDDAAGKQMQDNKEAKEDVQGEAARDD